MPPRTILHTGKGGAGKTTVAAATGRLTAARGLRTVVLSADPTGTLADALGAPVTTGPTQVDRDLWAQMVAPTPDDAADALPWPAAGAPAAPTPEELAVLVALRGLHAEERFDVIVVDGAATVAGLRLLTLPEAARVALGLLFPPAGRIMDGSPAGAPPPDPDGAATRTGYDDLRDLVALNEILGDREHCSVRVVVTPGPRMVDDARWALTHLSLHGLPADAVIVNRILPGDAGPHFARWQESQEARLQTVDDALAPIPVLRCAFQEHEVAGAAGLDRVGAELFAAHHPESVLAQGRPADVTVMRDRATLRLELLFASPQDVTLDQVDGHLLLQAGDHRRTLALPPALGDYRPTGATVRDDALLVDFERVAHPATDA